MSTVYLLHPKAQPEHLGLLPHFIDQHDPRPAREQFDSHYGHGGGWQPVSGFTMVNGAFVLQFPGDPPFPPLAMMHLRDERIFFYEHAFVAIVQPGGAFEVARMD